MRKCFAPDCMQKPELRQTGWHAPHPTHYCPVCRESYWSHDIKDKKNWKIGENLRRFPPQPYYSSPSKAKMLASGRYDWVRGDLLKFWKRQLKEEEEAKKK